MPRPPSAGTVGGVAVALDGVTKRFITDAGPVHAVNGIALQIDPGRNLAITGPSGCGKSTLLSLIGALEPATDGTIAVAGRRVTQMGEPERAALRRELIGFVFQSDNLQPFLTAVENISLQLALSGATDGYERSLELLSTLGLGHVAGKYPDQLSGGERQRVAVARAIVHRPRLILADEPTGALDVGNSVAVIDLLLDVQAKVGATLIVITHDPQIAERFDRRLALLDGRVIADSATTPAPMTDATGA